MPTVDQVGGLLRTVFALAGGFIIDKGWIDAQMWLAISGGLVAIGVALWSMWTNRPARVVNPATALPKDMVGALEVKEKVTAVNQ